MIELDGKLATAGWIDLHVHVFEWMTTFGLPPDDAGVHSGVTTAVDQGGTGAYMNGATWRRRIVSQRSCQTRARKRTSV